MAQLSQTGTPGVNVGILHPKLKHRFRVKFCNPGTSDEIVDGDKPYGAALTNQVTYVGSIVQHKGELSEFGVTPQYSVTMEFDDDVTNATCEALQLLFGMDKFDIRVEYLDAVEGVLRTHVLGDCSVETIMHDSVGYNNFSPDGETKFQFSFPSYFVKDAPSKYDDLMDSLSKMVITSPSKRSPKLMKSVDFSFKTLTIK